MKYTLTQLDSIRGNEMDRLLGPDNGVTWRYDVVPRKVAMDIALHNINYDDMQNLDCAKSWALIGPDIVAHPFETVEELKEFIRWMCSTIYA